jgi:hypothetical protein
LWSFGISPRFGILYQEKSGNPGQDRLSRNVEKCRTESTFNENVISQ